MRKPIFSICLAFVLGFWGVIAAPQVQPLQQASVQKKALMLLPRFVNMAVTPQNPYKPEIILVKPQSSDKPVVHEVIDFYQENKDYESLFSKSGLSNLCAPSSLANGLVYLKYNRHPPFGRIAAKHKERIKKNGDWVSLLFDLCKTSREDGTYPSDVEAAAEALIVEGGYGTANIYVLGAWAGDNKRKRAVTPEDLQAACRDHDQGVVLNFGWYWIKHDKNRKILQRNGGHSVAMAGYDALRPNVFYVSNPLTDYSQVYPVRYSRIELQRLPGDVEAPADMAWYTSDLVGGNFAVLEVMIPVLPALAFSAPHVAR